MNRSTSIHRLNADRGLKFRRQLYLMLNRLNNSLPETAVDPHLQRRSFVIDAPIERTSALQASEHLTMSPARALSDLFCQHLPWKAINQALKPIHQLDVGCGKGGYVSKFLGFSAGLIARYTGVDIQQFEQWETIRQQHPAVDFIQLNSNNIQEVIPQTANLITTQSAIEHFDDDLLFFQQLRDFIVQDQSRPLLQIHLLPSAATLRLYGAHGVRQYTPRTLSKITRLFSPFSKVYLYDLGGVHCNDLHYQYITKHQPNGQTLRDTQPQSYAAAVQQAIAADMHNPSAQHPTFYALVIYSYPTEPIF